MKRSVALAVSVIALVAASSAAEAKVRHLPPTPSPKLVTYYLHGTSQLGEQDQTILTGSPLKMDATAPTGSTDKGKFLENYGAGPNTACTANGAFAVWAGSAVGTLTGTVNVTFFTQNSPAANVDVRMFVDADSNECNSSTGGNMYPGAVAEKDNVALGGTGGKVTVSMPVTVTGKAAIAHSTVVLEISPSKTLPVITPELARILYDSTTAPSVVSFSCRPKAGQASC